MASDSELRDLLLSCSSFESDAKRLDCVDELILSIEDQAVVESLEQQSAQKLIPEESSTNDSSGQELGQEHLREPDGPVAPTSVSCNLIAVYKDDKKRWSFEFDNGQVWRQTEVRYLPKVENFPVRGSISKSVFGSHDLRAEEFGQAVKVKRLK